MLAMEFVGKWVNYNGRPVVVVGASNDCDHSKLEFRGAFDATYWEVIYPPAHDIPLTLWHKPKRFDWLKRLFK